jgi:hypothetical protein
VNSQCEAIKRGGHLRDEECVFGCASLDQITSSSWLQRGRLDDTVGCDLWSVLVWYSLQ